MGMTDPIADMLTRIRNANNNGVPHVDVPGTRVKQDLLEVFKREGFIGGYDILTDTKFPAIRIHLKYGPGGERVIRKIVRASRPGLRKYERLSEIDPVLNGQGMSVYFTSKGVMSDRECRSAHVGGERVCTIW